MMTTKITMENTEMLKLKKSFSLFLCILFALIPTLSFSACKDDGFEIVQSITYTTTEGKKITEKSRANLCPFDAYDFPSDETSYNSVDDNYRFDDLIARSVELGINNKTITSFDGLTEKDIGQTIGCMKYDYSDRPPTPIYYTFIFEGWVYDYLRVKIIDHTVVVIRDGYSAGGNPFDRTYTVTSYQITYFDEDK